MKKLLTKKFKFLTGFTLPELLVYLAIFSMIAVLLSSFVIWVYNANIKYQSMQNVSENLKRAMDFMVYEIHEARAVYGSTTNVTQLSLKTFHYAPDQETASFVDFFLCNGQICFKKEGSASAPLTSDKVVVDNLQFKILSATSSLPSVQIVLSVSFKNPLGKFQYKASAFATSTASLRVY